MHWGHSEVYKSFINENFHVIMGANTQGTPNWGARIWKFTSMGTGELLHVATM